MAEVSRIRFGPGFSSLDKFVEKVTSVKKWTASKFRTSKHSVLEQIGKVEKTTDVEIDKRISRLNDLHNRYREILISATAYSIHFNVLNNVQKALTESFYQLSLREVGLKKQLNDQNEMMRQFAKFAEEFSKQLEYFVSSIETLCTKTIRDTLKTVQVYENARLKFDANRRELERLQQNPVVAQKSIDELQDKVETLKQKYQQLKEDVRIKLSLLDENRLKVMRDQLANFDKGLNQYFTESIKALSQMLPKSENNDQCGENRVQPSFLEQ